MYLMQRYENDWAGSVGLIKIMFKNNFFNLMHMHWFLMGLNETKFNLDLEGSDISYSIL